MKLAEIQEKLKSGEIDGYAAWMLSEENPFLDYEADYRRRKWKQEMENLVESCNKRAQYMIDDYMLDRGTHDYINGEWVKKQNVITKLIKKIFA